MTPDDYIFFLVFKVVSSMNIKLICLIFKFIGRKIVEIY